MTKRTSTNHTSIAKAMAQSPSFRVTLSPHFVADVAAIRSTDVETFAVYDQRRTAAAAQRRSSRTSTASKGKAWARWALKLTHGLSVAALVDLVPEEDRAGTRSLVADAITSARALADQLSAQAAERDGAIAAARAAEDRRTRVLAG